MKLLQITSVKEYQKDICALFKKCKIEVYSTQDIAGHKLQVPKNIQDNWFSAHRDTYDSILFFAFTSEDLIDKMFIEIKIFNNKMDSNNPIRAIVTNIEKHI